MDGRWAGVKGGFNMARDYYDRDRSMWERGRDEVRSWFGDEEAERRRRRDARFDERSDWRETDYYDLGPGRRPRYEYDDAYGDAEHYRQSGRMNRDQRSRQRAADAEFDRDWDLDDRGGSGFEPYRSGGGRGGWHERDRQSMYGGSYGGRRAGRHYDDDMDISESRRRNQAYGGGRYSADPQGSSRYYSDYYQDDMGQHNHRGRGPRGYRRADERIVEDLSEALTWDRVVDASDVEVKVDGGEVTLSGTVASRRMKRRAEDIADGIRGVHDVHNQLRVSRDSLSGDQGSHQGRGPRQDMEHQGSGSSAGQERSGKEQGLGSGRTEGAEPGQQQRKFGS